MVLSLILAAAAWLFVAAQPASPAPASARTLMPVDEAASVPDFFTFRAELLRIIIRRDAAALLAVVDPDIKNGFGDDSGKASFERQWQPSSPDSEVWQTLAAVLALGGKKWGEDGFVAPYVSAAWPDDVDGFEHVAVVGDRVRVREAASLQAAEIARVSFAVLARARNAEAPEDWTPVVAPGGRVGYISSQYVRSPIDYRAYFTRKDARWWLVMFLAGD